MSALEPPLTPAVITNGHEPPAEPSTYDPGIFRDYLLALLPPVIGALPSELESLFDDAYEERVAQFAAEGGGVIYVIKVKDEVEG
jgi:dynein heavy chain 1